MKEAKPMKYEYKIIECDVDIMNRLGKEGWYLAAVTKDGKIIMMKRISYS